jgi:hypothetical protein
MNDSGKLVSTILESFEQLPTPWINPDGSHPIHQENRVRRVIHHLIIVANHQCVEQQLPPLAEVCIDNPHKLDVLPSQGINQYFCVPPRPQDDYRIVQD